MLFRSRGVTARRKRNQGRLEKLHQMRATRAAMIGPQGAAKLGIASDDVKTKEVIKAEHVTKRYGDRTIIKDLSLKVTRGDRIGLVGANGAGKTTLLKLLTGEIEPDEGTVFLAKTLDGVIIDQQRKLMAPEKRVREVLADGGEAVGVTTCAIDMDRVAQARGMVPSLKHDRPFRPPAPAVVAGAKASG